MRKLFVLFTAALVLTTAVFAQQDSKGSSSKGEVFAGYSYMDSGLQNFGLSTQSLNGVTLQATSYFHKNLGLTADVTRVSGSDLDQTGVNMVRYTYLFGPTYAFRSNSVVTPYVHVLVGADHERSSISQLGDVSSNAFATSFGGGFDVKLAEHWALRLGQFDYIHTNHSDGENHFRYSTGLVLKF